MEMSFIEKFIDDPLSYCPIWEPDYKHSELMRKIK